LIDAAAAGDALALAERIRTGATTARAVAEASLARAAQCTALGALRHCDAVMALAQADAIDLSLKARPRESDARPFLGVPFLMKDLGSATAGLSVTCGSAFLAEMPPATEDSELARRFRRAGLNPFGVTSVPEFGLSLATEPSMGPIARNPLDPRRSPGGSSGGAASAVASGIVAIAHATDAGGSTRVPAACCGLVGLKATRGAMPGGPGFGNHLFGIASEFVVSRSLRDAAAALDVVAGRAQGPEPDPGLNGAALQQLDLPLAPLRIGLCIEDGTGFALTAERRRAIADAADALAGAGHRIVRLPAATLDPWLDRSTLVFDRIICANLACGLKALDHNGAQRIERLTRAVLQRGRAMSGIDLMEAQHALVATSHGVWRLFDDVDVLLTPMLATAPPVIGSFPTDHDDVEAQWRRMRALAPYATLANVSGAPALTVPHGKDRDGLPCPIQLIGPMGGETRLLRLARVLEGNRPWDFAAPIAGLAI
jgi:amidase